MLTFLYRLLTHARRRDEVTLDMIGTFEEAREDARKGGVWNYLRFAMREIGGLLTTPGGFVPKNFWTLVGGWGIAGLALGVGVWYLWPASYTAKAVILIDPQRIPVRFVGNGIGFDTDRIATLKQQILTSTNLHKVLDIFGLYPHFRGHNTEEALLEKFRKAISIEQTGNTIRVVFTYEEYPSGPQDPVLAAEAGNRLTNELIDLNMAARSMEAEGTSGFLDYQAAQAAGRWEKLNGEIRALNSSNPRFDRLSLDRDLARKEYESLQQKRDDAAMLTDMERREEGERLVIIDPARVPEGPDVSRLQMALYGLGCGLLVGLVAWLWSVLRSDPSVTFSPEPSPGD